MKGHAVSDEPVTDELGDELPPLEVAVDMLDDVVKLLNGVDDLVVAHRRAAGDDHHTIARLQGVSGRVGDAWAAAVSARLGLRAVSARLGFRSNRG
jgi:hypothetical protein